LGSIKARLLQSLIEVCGSGATGGSMSKKQCSSVCSMPDDDGCNISTCFSHKHMSYDSNTSRLLLVAAASAAASSLLTYAVFRWHSSSEEETNSNARAGGAQPPSGDGNLSAPLRVSISADPYDPSPRKG
jgi:hypothetical protein